MRLYLSSYRLGRHVERLKALLPKRPRALIVANALDGFSVSLRRKLTVEEHDPYSELDALSFAVSDLDLRQFFGAHETLTKTLRSGDLVWVLGGNSFVLRRAMALSGLDVEVARLLRSDDLMYGGFSAGAVVAASTLRGIHLMDNPHEVPDGYPSAVMWDGLGLVDYAIVPHVNSDHPEARLADDAKAYLEENEIAFRALSDGDVIVRSGVDTRILAGCHGA